MVKHQPKTLTDLLTGAQLQDAIVELAHVLGYMCAHFRAARTRYGWRTACQYDAEGFPDLVLVGRGRVVFAEIKRENEQLTPAQVKWKSQLELAGAEYYLWRPSDWKAGKIEAALAQRQTIATGDTFRSSSD